jgi:methyltransferase (TIGR00027 family)
MNAFWKPLNLVPDEEDLRLHEKLCDPALVTERLGQLVPLLKFVGFRVEQMTPQKTILTVPLLESAMNQNGTHQAAVFYLIADYTLGVGMFATLPGCYTVGVHDRCHALPIQFWLRMANVEHMAPGNGQIRAEVSIEPKIVEEMRARLVAKGRCELQDIVKIYQGDQLIAITKHTMGMYADLPRVANTRASMAQTHRLKTSALMIAGLRGDPTSAALAGDQGLAVATRMSRASPQLPTLVQARSRHLQDYLSGSGRRHHQVLVLGAGLDPKPLHFASSSQTWFLCDLSEMLKDRSVRLEGIGISKGQHSIDVALDLRFHDWPSKLLASGFDTDVSTLVIIEGVSMYLHSTELEKTLAAASLLCTHVDSRLWLDHVTDSLLSMDVPEVTSFLASMARLGEPFITAIDDPGTLSAGWKVIENLSASDVLSIDEPVHREYRFALLGHPKQVSRQ